MSQVQTRYFIIKQASLQEVSLKAVMSSLPATDWPKYSRIVIMRWSNCAWKMLTPSCIIKVTPAHLLFIAFFPHRPWMYFCKETHSQYSILWWLASNGLQRRWLANKNTKIYLLTNKMMNDNSNYPINENKRRVPNCRLRKYENSPGYSVEQIITNYHQTTKPGKCVSQHDRKLRRFLIDPQLVNFCRTNS